MQLSPDEQLLPVAHFEKDPTRTFGIPFFIKIANGEKVANIRERIRQMIEVPEKDFEKVLFNQIMRINAYLHLVQILHYQTKSNTS